jgi:hypothetical protein
MRLPHIDADVGLAVRQCLRQFVQRAHRLHDVVLALVGRERMQSEIGPQVIVTLQPARVVLKQPGERDGVAPQDRIEHGCGLVE